MYLYSYEYACYTSIRLFQEKQNDLIHDAWMRHVPRDTYGAVAGMLPRLTAVLNRKERHLYWKLPLTSR